MIITCPHCNAQYGVDLVRFGLRARPVQCTACDWQWEAGGPEDDPAEFSVADEAVAIAADAPAEADIDSPPPVKEMAVAGRSEALAEPLLADPDRSGADLLTEDARGRQSPLADVADDREVVAGESWAGTVAAVDDVFEKDAERAADPVPATEMAESPDTDWPAIAPSPRRYRRRILAGVAAATVVIAIALLIAVQGPLSRALPGAAAVYHLFGLAPAPPGVGLDIRDVVSSREWTGLEDVLVISGRVANVASAPRTLPPLRVSLFDDEQTEVQTLLVEPAKPVLAAGESVPFVARIVNPATAARRMVVSFEVSAAPPG